MRLIPIFFSSVPAPVADNVTASVAVRKSLNAQLRHRARGKLAPSPAVELMSTGPCVTPLLSPVVRVGLHCPGPLIVALRVSAVGLGRIAVDERPQIHGMRGAAHFVLNREQVLAISRVDDVAKPVLVLVVFLGDQAALRQTAIRT